MTSAESHVWLPLHAHFQDVVLHGAPVVEDSVVLLGVFNTHVGKAHLGEIERNTLSDLNLSGEF